MKSQSAKLGAICLAAALVFIFLASCAAPKASAPPSSIQITDQLGRAVSIDKPPQRIISLAPSNTEILFALGLADRIVAVTDFCDYPPEAKEKPSIGGFSTPNIEEVVAHDPDLILATSIHESKIIPQLENRGLTVLALNPNTIDQVLEAIALVGRATGTEKNASALISDMQKRIKAVTDKVADLPPEGMPRTFYILWHDPLMTAGSGTLQNELIAKAGGRNIAQDISDYADISLEAVIAANPEVIISATTHGSMEEQTFQYAESEQRLQDTAARRNGRVYAVDGNLTSRPGPRIVDGLEKLAQMIHPEIFGPP